LGLVSSGTGVPVLIRVVALFNSGGDWVRCADLKFESLNFSVNVVLSAVRSGRFVKQVEEDNDEDDGSNKGIEHERGRVAR
jgi:membrane protein implicated in regulation of membrane protease activity